MPGFSLGGRLREVRSLMGSFTNSNLTEELPSARIFVRWSFKRGGDRFHVTSLPPYYRTITKDSSLASIVSSFNMAATSLSFDSLGIDCKPSIRTRQLAGQYMT